MSYTRISRHMKTPRNIVYRALLDAQAVAQWMVPGGMAGEVHELVPNKQVMVLGKLAALVEAGWEN